MRIMPDPSPQVDVDITSVRLSKHHINKASKDDMDRFLENFSVTLTWLFNPSRRWIFLSCVPSSVSELRENHV